MAIKRYSTLPRFPEVESYLRCSLVSYPGHLFLWGWLGLQQRVQSAYSKPNQLGCFVKFSCCFSWKVTTSNKWTRTKFYLFKELFRWLNTLFLFTWHFNCTFLGVICTFVRKDLFWSLHSDWSATQINTIKWIDGVLFQWIFVKRSEFFSFINVYITAGEYTGWNFAQTKSINCPKKIFEY